MPYIVMGMNTQKMSNIRYLILGLIIRQTIDARNKMMQNILYPLKRVFPQSGTIMLNMIINPANITKYIRSSSLISNTSSHLLQ
jgi:hypothetical protein